MCFQSILSVCLCIFQDTVYPERALSDKFNLVVQVARQVQVGTEFFLLLHIKELLVTGCFQQLINIFVRYGMQWDLRFNPQKSQLVCRLCCTCFGHSVLVCVDKVSWLYL